MKALWKYLYCVLLTDKQQQNERKVINNNVLLLIFLSFGKLTTILKYFMMFQWKWHLAQGEAKVLYAFAWKFPRLTQRVSDMVWNQKQLVSVFLCQNSSVLTMTHTSSQPTNRSAFAKPTVIIKAALPNQQLHPVVWTTCPAALLLSAFQTKKTPSFL